MISFAHLFPSHKGKKLSVGPSPSDGKQDPAGHAWRDLATGRHMMHCCKMGVLKYTHLAVDFPTRYPPSPAKSRGQWVCHSSRDTNFSWSSARHEKPWASSCWFLVEAWEGKVNWQRYGPSRSSLCNLLAIFGLFFLKTYCGPSPAVATALGLRPEDLDAADAAVIPMSWSSPRLSSLESSILHPCLFGPCGSGKKKSRSKQATGWTSGVQHGPVTPTQHNTLTACQHRETATPSEVWLLYPGQCWLWVLICLVYEKNLQRFNTASLWKWRVFIARNPSWFPINTNIYDHHCFYNTYLWQLDVTAAKHQQIQGNLRW